MTVSALVTREATRDDAAALLGLMRQLAQFEGYADHFAVTERDLVERGLAAIGKISVGRMAKAATCAPCSW